MDRFGLNVINLMKLLLVQAGKDKHMENIFMKKKKPLVCLPNQAWDVPDHQLNLEVECCLNGSIKQMCVQILPFT